MISDNVLFILKFAHINIYMKKTASFIALYFLISFCNAQTISLENKKNNIVITENTYKELIINFDIYNLSFIKKKNQLENYSLLTIDDYAHSLSIGNPDLPVFRKIIELPINSNCTFEVKNAEIVEINLADFGIKNKIFPVQPPADKSKTQYDFIINNLTYQSDAWYSEQFASVNNQGIIRGTNISLLNIAPIQYNPVKNTLKIYKKFTLTIHLNNGDIPQTLELKKKDNSPLFSNTASYIFNNKASLYKDAIVKAPVKYVIVADPMFHDALQPFIEWKSLKGFNVIEAYTDNPLVGNTTTSIKTYLQNLYNNGSAEDPSPSYILLVGDVELVPAFSGTAGTHITDLYYAEYTGDIYPEIYYGRFSAHNVDELSPQISKTIEYEKYLMPDPSFLGKVVMIAGVDGSYAQIHGNGQINYGIENYFNPTNNLYSYTFNYPGSADSAQQIIQKVSNGVGYANYTAHGSSNGWADPSFSVSDVAGLQNNHKYPLMVGNCCVTNKFDEPECFGEALLRANGKGAIGYIGASNNSYWDEDYYWGTGFRSIVEHPIYGTSSSGAYDLTFHNHGEPYSNWYITQGQMLRAGNLAVTQSGSSIDYYWEIYHLMGDPSLMVYFGVPAPLNVSYAPFIPLGSPSFTVTTEPYAYVAISQNGILLCADFANDLGEAVLQSQAFTTPGLADIIVTAQNRQPYFGNVSIQVPNGPYVLLKSKYINDASGNNNSLPDFGETIFLHTTLKNYGINDTAITAIIRTNDPYITLLDTTHAFGNILQNDTILINNSFSFTIANNIPDQHRINFLLLINDNNNNTWTSSFSFVVNAPYFTVQNIIIDDAAGNNNGRLDPNETVNIIVNTANTGHTLATNTNANISSNNTNINISNSNFGFGNFSDNSLRQASFNTIIGNSLQNGSIVEFLYNVGSGAYTSQKTFRMMVGVVGEDWETGNMNHLSWLTSGDANWFVSNQEPYEGLYCLQSGIIGDNSFSELSLSVNTIIDDSISFYKMVSSEENYDFLKFSVDGNVYGEWSGVLDWSKSTFFIPKGFHLFKWSYIKDYSTSYELDLAKIDDIILPQAEPNISINENNPDKIIVNAYPNPFNNKLNIDITSKNNENINLTLFNTIGEVIFRKAILQNNHQIITINTENYPSGVYFCKIEGKNTNFVKKVVLSK